jgi:hypothetical protein
MSRAVSNQMQLRGKNALISGAASFLALLLMALSVGGSREFFPIVFGFLHLFLLITLVALVIGVTLTASRARWSVIVGAILGIMGGCLILLHAMSQI